MAWDWIADNIKRGQDYLLHNTTLGIPAIVQTEGMSHVFYTIQGYSMSDFIFHATGIHGFLIGNATIFNSPIAYGCSWNRDVSESPSQFEVFYGTFIDLTKRIMQLIEKMGKIIGQEAKALGVNQLFAPVVDLARELRYGRVSFIHLFNCQLS